MLKGTAIIWNTLFLRSLLNDDVFAGSVVFYYLLPDWPAGHLSSAKDVKN